MLSIKNLQLPLSKQNHLVIEALSLAKGQSLLVVGDNASGKTALAQLLIGHHKNFSGELKIPNNIACLSFELEAETLAFDRYHDNSEFSEGGVDLGRNASEIITEDINLKIAKNQEILENIVTQLNIANLLNTPFKCLSTGETRKVLMAKALLLQPDILVLDEPYAGLDIQSQHMLTELLSQLITQGVSIILFDFFHSGLPKNFQQMLVLSHGEVQLYGNMQAVLNSHKWHALNQHHISLPHHLPDAKKTQKIANNHPLVKLDNVSVNFLGKAVFNNLSWQFDRQQHWQIIGPNGCGKSTLLAMISGDSTKAYGKNIWLFGKKRGSGETVWDIKQHYGVVSAQLHRDYRVATNVLETVLSGFFDSIGLYQQASEQQINVAKQWLVLINLKDKATTAFNQLSYGEQRLILIIRAVIKLPLILILDEPCQGLDNHNRAQVLALVDYIAQHSQTQILLVSHDSRDQLKCITHHLTFTQDNQKEGYTATMSNAMISA